MMDEKKWDMRIKSLKKVDSQTEKSDSITYQLQAEDKDGFNKVTITSVDPFKGLNAKDGVVCVKLLNSQLIIDDFREEKS